MTMSGAVAQRLSELITERNLTMNGLAQISAVPPSTVKNIFYGKSRNSGIVTLKLLCDGMGITITEFFDTSVFRELEIEEIE